MTTTTMHQRVVALQVLVSLAFCGLGVSQIEEYLSTMTPYPYSTSGPNPPYSRPPGCALRSLDLVGRHGSRYSTAKTQSDISARISPIISRHREALRLSWMKDWVPHSEDFPNQGLLSSRGESEWYGIGRRLSAAFPEVLSPFSYNPNFVRLFASFKERTSQSATSFGRGAFRSGETPLGSAPPMAVMTGSERDDAVLRFFDCCERYAREVSKDVSGRVLREHDEFARMRAGDLAQSVSKRTGIPEYELSYEVLNAMYEACTEDVTVRSDVGQWCSVFSRDDLVELDFLEDLDTFYTRGPGIPLSYLVAAPLFQDVLANMVANAAPRADDAMVVGDKPSNSFRASLRFGHAETVLPFVALLGLTSDPMLTANWTSYQMSLRQWKSSSVSPLAANICFLLWQCGGSGSEPAVELLVNERSTVIPGCKTRLCPLSSFRSLYSFVPTVDAWRAMCNSTA